MANPDIQIGKSLEDATADLVSAWKAAESRQDLPFVERLSFKDWDAICAVLTQKRYELLRHLRKSPESGVRALARALGHDVKTIHADVVSLAELGFITRDATTDALSSPIDEITSTIRIAV